MVRVSEQKQGIQRWLLWLSLAIPVGGVVVYLLLWYGPDLLARHDVGDVAGQLRALRLQQARDAARGRLLTFGAGLFAAGALLFTGQNYRLARQTLEVTKAGQQRAHELTEQGQVTERYTRAIEQLGSDKLDVRIGGIYALERIARDSARDQATVIDVLAAFVRQHSHEQWHAPGQPAGGNATRRITRPDVQAAITVIGRREFREGHHTPADLSGVILARANLSRANLIGAELIEADLFRANLKGANLADGVLNQADLTDADLSRANLTRASLFHANLLRVDLAEADLTNADLSTADLTDVNLADAKLIDANLEDAKLSLDATVPAGWERDPTSGRLRRIVPIRRQVLPFLSPARRCRSQEDTAGQAGACAGTWAWAAAPPDRAALMSSVCSAANGVR